MIRDRGKIDSLQLQDMAPAILKTTGCTEIKLNVKKIILTWEDKNFYLRMDLEKFFQKKEKTSMLMMTIIKVMIALK